MKTNYIVNHDSILKDYLLEIGLSRHFCKKVKLYGKMFINDKEAKNYFEVKTGDKITLEISEELNKEIVPIEDNNFKLDIRYEDEHILIINKPVNLASLPTKKHFYDNVISLVKKYYLEQNIESNIHIINRLDLATSGLMVIAKDGLTHYLLSPKDNEKIIKRNYYALIEGIMTEKSGIINLPIDRLEGHPIKRCVRSDGKEAITEYKIIKEFDNKSLVDINLITGRTHQIRVHFSHLGHPLFGDAIYNEKDTESKRLYLHCYKVEFVNPHNNEKICVITEPSDF